MNLRNQKLFVGLGTLVLLAGLLFPACAAPAPPEEIGSVEVLGVWGGHG